MGKSVTATLIIGPNVALFDPKQIPKPKKTVWMRWSCFGVYFLFKNARMFFNFSPRLMR